MTPPHEASNPYVGRGGLKLRHALDEFGMNVSSFICADFGCNVGGFTDCLLQAGAAKVYAVDTGYGALAYKLRIDSRVAVLERTNALHAQPPDEEVDLVTIDMAWTPQRLCIPAALRWLGPRRGGRIITLIKPHYEASDGPEKSLLHDGVLLESDAERVMDRVRADFPAMGVELIALARSPIVGGKGKKNVSGNVEFLALLKPLS